MVSRRRILQTTGSVALLATAGCLSGGEGNGGVEGTVLLSVTDGDDEAEALSHDHVSGVGNVDADGSSGGYTLAVGLSDEGVESLTDALESVGGLDDPDSVELRVYHDGEVANAFGLDASTAEDLSAGEFRGVFALELQSQETAEALQSALDG